MTGELIKHLFCLVCLAYMKGLIPLELFSVEIFYNYISEIVTKNVFVTFIVYDDLISINVL